MTGPQTEWLGCGLNPLPKTEINQPLAETPNQVKTAFLNNIIHGTHTTECVTHKACFPLRGLLQSRVWGLDDLPREVRTHVHTKISLSVLPFLGSPQPGSWNLDPSGGGRAAFMIQLETLPLKNTKTKTSSTPPGLARAWKGLQGS